MRRFLWLAWFFLASAVVCPAAGHGFTSLFDGKTLTGWGGTDMSYWSVEDGCLTGTSTEAHPTAHTRWIVWQVGEVGDFELKLKFKIAGSETANSGIQFRTAFNADGTHADGYQADLTRDAEHMGLLYDEGTGRTYLARRGQKGVIDANGKISITNIGDPDALFKIFKRDEWNDYTVIARGRDLKAIINGHLMSEVVDNDQKFFHPTGWIGLQMHRGLPMKVQFKDIRLKRY